MATKVHDQDDEEEFAEIDIILAQAKRDRKQRRNMNLSDIPENFAHVPPLCEPQYNCAARAVSFDTSQPDFASRDRSLRAAGRHNHPKLHILGMMAPMKWLRGYMGCLTAVQDSAVASPTRPASRRHSGS